MPNAPEEFKVEQLVGSEPWAGKDGPMVTDEVLFEGDGRTWKIHRPAADQQPVTGAVLRGWKNADKGSFGIAKDRPQNGGERRSRATTSTGGRDIKTEESIQRQTAAKCAAEMAAAVGGQGPVVLANFEEFFRSAHGLIAGKSEDAETS